MQTLPVYRGDRRRGQHPAELKWIAPGVHSLQPVPEERRAMDGEMSWGKAGLHVLIACGALMAIGIVFAFLGAFRDPRAAGEQLGKEVFWVVLATLAASWAFQTGKGALGLVLAGIVVVLFAVEILGFVRLAHNPAAKAGAEQDLAL